MKSGATMIDVGAHHGFALLPFLNMGWQIFAFEPDQKNREQLLKLGVPSGRITLPEDGHTIEIYQYSANGASLGTVRLSDGRVSSVLIPATAQ